MVLPSKSTSINLKQDFFSNLNTKKFESFKKCAIMTHPFPLLLTKEDDELKTEIESRIFLRPSYAPEMVSEFKSDFFRDSLEYAALHWRYDHRDFISEKRCAQVAERHQRESDATNERQPRDLPPYFKFTYKLGCTYLQPIFDDVTQFATELAKELKKRNYKNLYIAAPPFESNFIGQLTQKLVTKGINVVNYYSAMEFVNRRYPNCQHFKVQGHFLTRQKFKIDTKPYLYFSITKKILFQCLNKRFVLNPPFLFDR